MRTSETLLLDFIKQSPQFRIPVNQRRYAWTRRHCRQLWDDILDAGERQDVREHFLGPIMYVAAVDPLNAHWAPFMVYDGQQRLTAMYYVFIAPDAPLPNRSNRFLYIYSGRPIHGGSLRRGIRLRLDAERHKPAG